MTREQLVRDLVAGAIPNDIERWDLLVHPNGETYDLMTNRKLTEAEEEAVTITANLLPDEIIVFHPITA